MSVPGSDILAMALMAIEPTEFQLLRFKGRALNAVGIYVPSYDLAEAWEGSVQPVARSRYLALGLDFNKRYITIFVSTDAKDLNVDRASDLISWNDALYSITSDGDWFELDGWVKITCIQTTDKVV